MNHIAALLLAVPADTNPISDSVQGTLTAEGAAATVDSIGDLTFGGTFYPFAAAILGLAFLMMVAEQFLNMRAGQKPDWGRPFVRVAGFMLLLALYTPLQRGVRGAVGLLGRVPSAAATINGAGPGALPGVLAVRAERFANVRKEQAERLKQSEVFAEINREKKGDLLPSVDDISDVAGGVVNSMMTSLVDTLLYAMTWLTFTIAAFAIFAIKVIGAAMTKILLEVGPVMIALAALPGLTSRYLSAWVYALIEVTAWGPVSGILLRFLATVNTRTTADQLIENANFAEDIVLNFVYTAMFFSIPAITHMILSGAASSVGSTGMAAAMGGLAAAGKRAAPVAGAAAGAAATGISTAGQAAGAAAGAAASRIGDVATGGATQGTMNATSAAITSSMAGSTSASSSADDRALHAKRGAIEKQRRGD